MVVLAVYLFILCLPVHSTILNAQRVSLPLVLQVSGDFWAWNGPQSDLQQRTNWGHNQDPSLSPDGQSIAYKATAQLAIDAMKRKGSTAIGAAPVNTWVLDVATGAPTRVHDKPSDASLQQDGKSDKFTIRIDPTWSPYSKALAWTELVVDKSSSDASTQQLVIYELVQKTQKVIVSDLPTQSGSTTTLKVEWGNPGLAIWTITSGPDAKGKLHSQDALILFNADSKLLSTVKIASLYEFKWIKDSEKDYIAILAQGPENAPLSEPQWLLLDPTSGQIAGMPGVPEMYSLLAPSGLSLYPGSIGTLPEWQIAGVGKLGNVDDVYAFSHVLGISPDGQQIAYVKQGAAYVYNKGKTTKIAPSDVYGLAWGPVAWRVRRKGLGQ